MVAGRLVPVVVAAVTVVGTGLLRTVNYLLLALAADNTVEDSRVRGLAADSHRDSELHRDFDWVHIVDAVAVAVAGHNREPHLRLLGD